MGEIPDSTKRTGNMPVLSWYKISSYGSLYYSTIGGCFFCCLFFADYVHKIVKGKFIKIDILEG